MNLLLCMDGGGSRTRAGLYTAEGALLRECEAPPANPLSYGEAHTLRVVAETAHTLQASGAPLTLALGLAGAGDNTWREHFAQKLFAALPNLEHLRITSDLDPLLHANAPDTPALFAIAGTGSSVLAKNAAGEILRCGGRGTVFGDEGGAYALATRALRAAAHAQDGITPPTALQQTLPAALGMDAFHLLVPWSLRATKQQIAALAKTVDTTAAQGDPAAQACIRAEAESLAAQILATAKKLPKTPAPPLCLNGGLVENSTAYRNHLVQTLQREGLAITACPPPLHGHRALLPLAQAPTAPHWAFDAHRPKNTTAPSTLESAATPPLDALPPAEIVRTMSDTYATLAETLNAQTQNLTAAIEAAAHALNTGGRIIYIGAGTSGRLGVLDASECPPTFGIPPERVTAIIAGGPAAITQSVEGAEDDTAQAERDVDALHPDNRDFILGIAASGATPYTRQALQHAKKHGATTALLCCNPATRNAADILIALDTGPETLPGSTRLKAGTATKIALNIISTGAMAQAGYIYRGRMAFMRPLNTKLRDRAHRMLCELAAIPPETAHPLLEAANGSVAAALLMHQHNWDAPTAQAALQNTPRPLHTLLDPPA